MEYESSHEHNTKTLEKMLELAQFGAEGHRARWQVEFRIFISYITLLVIGLYQINKPENPMLKGIQDKNNPWLLVIPVLVPILIHYLYCFWQKNISIALINDVRRRDFYTEKAQCLSYHLARHPNAVFQPSWTKTVSLNRGGRRSDEPITEVDLFNERHPNIIKKASWSEFWNVKYHTHIWFQIGVPTLLLICLIVTIFNEHLWFQIGVPIVMGICFPILAILDNWLFWSSKP